MGVDDELALGRTGYKTKWTLDEVGIGRNGIGQNGYGKASELVPCNLLPHWNSMRFFATVSLSDMNSLQEVKFATLYRQSSNTSR